GLLSFSQAQFPRRTGVLDGGQGRSTRTTVVAGNHNVIGLGFGNTGSHSAYTHFGHQLHRDIRLGVHVFQVVNQLGQIFDGVNVVVGRGRNQAHTGDGVT